MEALCGSDVPSGGAEQHVLQGASQLHARGPSPLEPFRVQVQNRGVFLHFVLTAQNSTKGKGPPVWLPAKQHFACPLAMPLNSGLQ